jgi:hypothetical protein
MRGLYIASSAGLMPLMGIMAAGKCSSMQGIMAAINENKYLTPAVNVHHSGVEHYDS